MALLRLFFAVPVAAGTVPSLNALHPLLSRQSGWRAPSKTSWHVTVAFLGNIDAALLPQLQEWGREAAANTRAGRIALTHLEWWPSAHRPRLLVATGDADCALAQLQHTLNTRLAQEQLPCDTRPLRPHLTLARLQRGAKPLNPLPACDESVAIDRLALYRSDPGSRGATSTYTVIWRHDLPG